MDELPEAMTAKKKPTKLTRREQRRMQAEESRRNRELEEFYNAVKIMFNENMPDALFRKVTQLVF